MKIVTLDIDVSQVLCRTLHVQFLTVLEAMHSQNDSVQNEVQRPQFYYQQPSPYPVGTLQNDYHQPSQYQVGVLQNDHQQPTMKDVNQHALLSAFNTGAYSSFNTKTVPLNGLDSRLSGSEQQFSARSLLIDTTTTGDVSGTGNAEVLKTSNPDPYNLGTIDRSAILDGTKARTNKKNLKRGPNKSDEQALKRACKITSPQDTDNVPAARKPRAKRDPLQIVEKKGDDDAAASATESCVIETVSVKHGLVFKDGNVTLFGDKDLYTMRRQDFTLVTTDPFDGQYVPLELKKQLHNRWYFALHVSHGMGLTVTRNALTARVTGGQILAYRYVELSIEGNNCVYYGFIPSVTSDQAPASEEWVFTRQYESQRNIAAFNGEGTHRVSRIATKAMWPRKMIVYLKKSQMGCDCSDGCSMWSLKLSEKKGNIVSCMKRIPWSQIYVMMGDEDETCVDVRKEPRLCVVCARCYDCSKSSTFCRTHKKCNHTKAVLFESRDVPMARDSDQEDKDCSESKQTVTVPIVDAKIKRCLKYKI